MVWLAENGVEFASSDLGPGFLAQFAAEFVRVPEVFRQQARWRSGVTVRLLQGAGVSEDPAWSGGLKTSDGRDWSGVPGSGGAPYRGDPARFVINRLYQGQGSFNLVLHEFGHSVDSMRRFQGFSSHPEWRALSGPGTSFDLVIRSRCGDYCGDDAGEGFAEAFAIYFSCAQSRAWLRERAPAVAEWIGSLESRL